MASRNLSQLYRTERNTRSASTTNNMLPPMHIERSLPQVPMPVIVKPFEPAALSYVELKRISHEQNMLQPPPAWIKLHEQLIADLCEINKQIELLNRSIYNRPFNFDDNTSANVCTDEKQQKLVQSIINQFQLATNHLHVFSQNSPTIDSKNALKKVTIDLSSAYAQFKITHGKLQNTHRYQYTVANDDRDTRNIDAYSIEMLEYPATLQQQEYSQYAHRLDEIEQITNDIQDLSLLFTQLHNMVLEQGTVIDRIDYNIDQTLNNVQEGKKQLIVAEKKSRSAVTSWLCIVLLIIGCVGLIIAIAEKTK